jgi:hypothetical protein
MTEIRQIVILSDVTIGFAVPQVVFLAKSLGMMFGARVTIVEPDMKNRRTLIETDGVEFRRVSTRMPPHDELFHIEYVRAQRELLAELKPDILVVLNAAVLPPLLMARERPKMTVYYMLESLDHQLATGGRHYFDLNRMATSFIDVVLVPERRRYEIDAKRLGWTQIPAVEVLNVGAPAVEARKTPERCRFLFAGTLNEHSGFDVLASSELKDYEIDVAGPMDSDHSKALLDGFLGGGDRRRYLGLLPHTELIARMDEYAYRIVLWKANDTNTLFASPNKFFEAVSRATPPVSTPHPQVRDIANRYRCAILADGYDGRSILDAIHAAAGLFGSPTYDRMVRGCLHAGQTEVHWDAQFEKVRVAITARMEAKFSACRTEEKSASSPRARTPRSKKAQPAS